MIRLFPMLLASALLLGTQRARAGETRDFLSHLAAAEHAATGADARIDLGAILRALGPPPGDRGPAGEARVTRDEWRGLTEHVRRLASSHEPDAQARALAYLHRAYARRSGLDPQTLAEIRELVLAQIQRTEPSAPIGGGARAWLDRGRARPLAGVAPEILAQVNADLLAERADQSPTREGLRARLRLAEIWLGADPRDASASLAKLATAPALADPALTGLLDPDVWTTGSTVQDRPAGDATVPGSTPGTASEAQ